MTRGYRPLDVTPAQLPPPPPVGPGAGADHEAIAALPEARRHLAAADHLLAYAGGVRSRDYLRHAEVAADVAREHRLIAELLVANPELVDDAQAPGASWDAATVTVPRAVAEHALRWLRAEPVQGDADDADRHARDRLLAAQRILEAIAAEVVAR